MKIFLSLIASIFAGQIIGYVFSKVFFIGISTIYAIALGLAAGVIGIELARWSRKSFMGSICALIIVLHGYFILQIHIYLPIKNNPPEGTPAAVVELKTSREPEGFFKYAQLTAGDQVETYGGRRRGRQIVSKGALWFGEIFVMSLMSVAIARNPLED